MRYVNLMHLGNGLYRGSLETLIGQFPVNLDINAMAVPAGMVSNKGYVKLSVTSPQQTNRIARINSHQRQINLKDGAPTQLIERNIKLKQIKVYELSKLENGVLGYGIEKDLNIHLTVALNNGIITGVRVGI